MCSLKKKSIENLRKMKRLIYISACIVLLSACGGTEDYDAYVKTLQAQPAVIDTISSPASYAAYLDSLEAKAREFDEKGIDLNETQTDELEDLSQTIQGALEKAYDRIARRPVTLPDAVEVPE